MLITKLLIDVNYSIRVLTNLKTVRIGHDLSLLKTEYSNKGGTYEKAFVKDKIG